MRVIVIGSGPGGMTAALKAAELGAEVTVIEKDQLGGVCLNEGCIPTKKLLDSAGKNYKIIPELIEEMREDIQRSFQMSKIEVISGQAKFRAPHSLSVYRDDTRCQIIEAEKIIIATGSLPARLDFLDYTQPGIMTSKEALNLSKIPESLIIIGGGVIGLEFATIFHSLGVKVTIIEMTETLLPGEDKRIADAINFALKKQGIEILTKTICQTIIPYGLNRQKVILNDGKVIETEKILVAVGRLPNAKNLELEKAGVKTDPKGFILVNKRMQTNVPGIYAVGDAVGKYFLAHVASREGEMAAENALGKHSKMDYRVIPRCIYTRPEIASVGLNIRDAEKLGLDVKIARANFSGNALARVKEKTFGFCQLVIDNKTQKILGAQIIGENAAELIHEISISMAAKMTLAKLKKVVFAHPTLSEIIGENVRR